LLLPILITIPVSFTPTRYVSLPSWDQLSLAPYRSVFQSQDWIASIVQSIVIGLSASALAVAIGTSSSIGLWRIAPRWGQPVRWLALAPLIVPPVVSALAFYRLLVELDRSSGLQFLDSYPGLILAHAILGIPFVVMPVSAALTNLPVQMEQAARNLGASAWQAIAYVILPNIKAGVAAGPRFALILSSGRVLLTPFISRPRPC